MPYNVERLERLRDEIEHESTLGKHDQGTWGNFKGSIDGLPIREGGRFAQISCPSAACAAGWTVINEKARMLVGAEELLRKGEASASHCITAGGDLRSIDMYAAELLGLDNDEQNLLFAGHHSTEEVLHMIDQLIVAAKHGRSWRDQRLMEQAARYENA